MTVYFIEMEGSKAIKIGFTAKDDVTRRIAQLQTGQPNKLLLLGAIPGDQDAERGLHTEFKEFRTNGEWFIGPPSFRWFIRFIAENKFPWYISRAYRMLDEWREEIIAEIPASRGKTVIVDTKGRELPDELGKEIAWRDKQIGRQHRQLKERDEKMAKLQMEILRLKEEASQSVANGIDHELLALANDLCARLGKAVTGR